MKLTINLSRRQIDSLRNFLQNKYKSKKKVEALARVYLLEFIAAELIKDTNITVEYTDDIVGNFLRMKS